MAAVSEKDELHRITRVPLDPFFSKVGIVRVEPRVLQRVKKLCGRFDALADTGKPVNITHAVGSLANDVISSILFEEPSDYLGDEDFNASWFEILKKGTMTVPLLAHLPWLARVMAMPAVRAATERVTNWRIWDDKRIRRQLVATRLRPGDEAKTRDGTTFFDHLVHSDLVEAHFGNGGFTRLAQLMQQAGSHNIAHTTGTIIAYLCMDKEKEECLRKVLVPLFDTDNPDKSPTSKELEKVPYLQACILEGFRMAIGAMLRAPRISPDTDLEFQKWIIPKGTPVAMSSYWMHMDATVFPNPEVFIPERWLSNNPEKLKLMHNYSVPFSKGSRACLGQNLVRLQMSLSLAHIYRPGAPRIKLYNTMKSDFVAKHGLLYPWQNLESQGRRLLCPLTMPGSVHSEDEPMTDAQPLVDEEQAHLADAGFEDEEEEQEEQSISLLPGATDTAASFQFHNENHTLGNALRYMIMKNPEVEFCGYTMPHPSEPKMNLRIQTYSSTTVFAVLEKGFDDLMEMCDVVTDKFTLSRNEFNDKIGKPTAV
ncbi:hypothetical protein FQN57_006369 [Myotisia sp. PD_48]|nr:hypothetical protein FQN57_006369 [Myotisia sp. PD_48]